MTGTPTTFSNPKVHVVNLDLPPNQRWVEIAKEYKDKLIPLRDYLDRKQAEELGCCDPFAANVMAWATKSMFAPTEFVQELQGIASITDDMDLTFNKLLSFNIGYNFLAHCTSISTSKNPVGEDTNKEGPFHLRNMDWDEEVAAGFCDITIDVDFQKSGVSLFRITTWVGMVGCLTGMRYHTTEDPLNTGWSISLNYRKTDESLGMLRNITAGFFRYHGIEFLMRHTLQTEPSFTKAVHKLCAANIMAPCYLTIAGSQHNEGVLLTRKRRGEATRLTLTNSEDDARRFIVQTNICHWKDKAEPSWYGTDKLLENALERRDVATKNMSSFIGDSTGDSDDHFMRFSFHILSRYPTCNHETIYQNVMRPATNYYQTRIVHNPPHSYDTEIIDPLQTKAEVNIETNV